jgi:hypothetical protein
MPQAGFESAISATKWLQTARPLGSAVASITPLYFIQCYTTQKVDAAQLNKKYWLNHFGGHITEASYDKPLSC